jgi:hypothetical protein
MPDVHLPKCWTQRAGNHWPWLDVIILPAERLPSGTSERHARLRDYFCDKDAEAILGASGWELALAWPDGDDRHVDPKLDQALAWWDKGIRREDMALSARREGRILRCLYDTWTLQSWSEWLARHGATSIQQLTILHVDDHRDLGSPRLFVDSDGWIDSITGARCDLHDPTSTRSAIESGAIGMGSFLTPFLHVARYAEVRHLCQPPKVRGTADHTIQCVFERDTLIDPERERPSIRLDRSSTELGPGTYRITPDVDSWLEGIGEGPILFHIDMDYFNNRYDGDSDWPNRSDPFDPPLAQIFEKIDELTNALSRRRILERLEDIVIAFSPGFFPSEFWCESDARLAKGLITYG